MNSRRFGLTAVGVLLAASVAGAAPQEKERGVAARPDDGERRGYWWKKEPPAAADERELGPPPPEAVLQAMHPRDLEKMLDAYRDHAIWKTTPEAVTWYYQLQDVARRKARAFMNVTELVMLGHPDLNMQTVYPTNPVGQAARYKERTEALEARLHAERDRAALVMLSQPGCEYCSAQRGILKYFHEKYGWEVVEIDLQQNPAAVARFGTDYTPTTVVIFRDRPDWQPVALGVETLERIEEGTYRAIRYVNGEVSAEQYTVEERQDGGLYDPRRSGR